MKEDITLSADIHYVIERKLGGQWVGVFSTVFTPRQPMIISIPDERLDVSADRTFLSFRERNYTLFAALASVRDKGATPKGIPTDVSILGKASIDDWGSDGHSHTWFPMQEFLSEWIKCDEAMAKAAVTEKISPKGDEIRPFIDTVIDTWDDELNDLRIVCWFDN